MICSKNRSPPSDRVRGPAKVRPGAGRMRDTQPDNGSGLLTQARRRPWPAPGAVQPIDIPVKFVPDRGGWTSRPGAEPGTLAAMAMAGVRSRLRIDSAGQNERPGGYLKAAEAGHYLDQTRRHAPCLALSAIAPVPEAAMSGAGIEAGLLLVAECGVERLQRRPHVADRPQHRVHAKPASGRGADARRMVALHPAPLMRGKNPCL